MSNTPMATVCDSLWGPAKIQKGLLWCGNTNAVF